MTGAYTVHLNMQEYLWDGIKRDRLIWLGDMHPEVATIMSVFGYNEVVNKSIDLACEQFPLPQWLNGISTYSMWYLIIHHEWYMHNGDISFLQRHRNYITGVIDRIDECVDEEISTFVPDGPEEGEYNLVRSKRFPIKPMTRDEAILQMKMEMKTWLNSVFWIGPQVLIKQELRLDAELYFAGLWKMPESFVNNLEKKNMLKSVVTYPNV